MGNYIDITGIRFKWLTVMSRCGSQGGKPYWLCKCDCGNEVKAAGANLQRGHVKSCGCWVRRNMIVKECVVCQKKMYLKKSYADKAGTYCSTECMAEGYKERMIGDSNPNHKHGQSRTLEYRRPYVQAWHEANPEKRSEFNRTMKAKRKLATGTHTAKDIQEKLKLQWNCCYWCFTYLHSYEVDHIVPLARGGSNCKDNVVPTCALCNRQKRDMFVSEWILKPNCRLKRQTYDAGKYSEKRDGAWTSNSFVCVGTAVGDSGT
jgi:5-methylcytosine-specific restriction endonuclease McrA